MKTICVVSPCYNEEQNVEALYGRLSELFAGPLSGYALKLLFIDNRSTDGTRAILERLCAADRRVMAIFNSRNFGHIRSPYHALLQAEGDCCVAMASDLQDPPEMLVDMVAKWEAGFKVVIAVKTKSRENPLMFALRKAYYRLVRSVSDVELIDNFTGYGLYDRRVIEELKKIDDPYPYFRGLIAEVGFERATVPFTQPRRERGVTKNNFMTLYDMAMLGFTSTSKIPLRVATMTGFFTAGLSLLVAVGYLVAKLVFWDRFPMGTAPLIIALFFFGSVQLFFIGLLGEYILNINARALRRPLVVEEKRINFE
jgi:polyisoprenyl-phosphate glycosyltransferase